MRFSIFFVMLFVFNNCSVKSQRNSSDAASLQAGVTTIYLVRHAEKEKDETSDPALDERGQQRATQLAKMLGDSNIKNIYSTDYQRTRMTGTPLATQLGLDLEIYSSEDEMVAILDTIAENALIVGHSNTIPRLINRLLGQQKLDDLQENEYDKLFSLEKYGETYQLSMESF